jgi:hypothetical protein
MAPVTDQGYKTMDYVTMDAVGVIPSRSLRGLSATIPIETSVDGLASSMMNNNSTTSASSTHDDMAFDDENLGLLFLLFAAILIVILVVIMVARDCHYRKQGIEVWPRSAFRRRQEGARATGETYEADRALAEELQRQLNEEEHMSERLAKRKERQRWYEYYLENSSKVGFWPQTPIPRNTTPVVRTTTSDQIPDAIALRRPLGCREQGSVLWERFRSKECIQLPRRHNQRWKGRNSIHPW